jgi:CheY-like chemotaxis protein
MGLTLDSHGAETVAVGSAAEALAVFASSSFDAIVSDIAMPAMDGYALLEQIRQVDLTRGRQTLAVAVTAFARVEDRERALRAGYQAHVTKPIEPGQLVATIGDLAVRGGRLM